MFVQTRQWDLRDDEREWWQIFVLLDHTLVIVYTKKQKLIIKIIK